jgi:non-heme chloroperoxidase
MMAFIEMGDGTRLFVRDWAGGGKPVLFVAGWALSSAMWQSQMMHLAEHGRRCVAYDRRGHGRSDDPGRGYDYDTLADDLATLLARLELDEVTVVAHSMGGGEVVRYLSRHGSARVARVLLLAPVLPFPLRTASNPDAVDGALFEQTRAQWLADFPRWLEDNADAYVGMLPAPHAVSPERREWTRQDMLQTSLHAAVACNRAIATTDFRDELRKVTVPTLIIQGDRDASMPLELSGKPVAALVPGSRLVVYEQAPHGLYLSHRDRLNRDLLELAGG